VGVGVDVGLGVGVGDGVEVGVGPDGQSAVIMSVRISVRLNAPL